MCHVTRETLPQHVCVTCCVIAPCCVVLLLQGIVSTLFVWLFTALLFALSVGMSDVCVDPEGLVLAQASGTVTTGDILYFTTCDVVRTHTLPPPPPHTSTLARVLGTFAAVPLWTSCVRHVRSCV